MFTDFLIRMDLLLPCPSVAYLPWLVQLDLTLQWALVLFFCLRLGSQQVRRAFADA
jgi:hypothetical protein